MPPRTADLRLCEGAALDDLDPERIEAYRQELSRRRPGSPLVRQPTERLLLQAGAVVEVKSQLRPTLTGILFFGLMGFQCLRDIPYMIRTNETGEELTIPLWPFRVVMVLICFVFVMKLIIYLLYGRKKEEKEEVRIEREGIVIPKEDP